MSSYDYCAKCGKLINMYNPQHRCPPALAEAAEFLVAQWWSIKEEWEETSLDDLTKGELNDLGNKVIKHADKIIRVLRIIVEEEQS